MLAQLTVRDIVLIEQAVLEGELDLAITMLPTKEEGPLSALDLDRYPIQVVLPDQPRWRGDAPGRRRRH
jgi:DNA-binding transcriptional LysR family regulator